MATYNGHKSWAFWNVALWIANDEGLYRLVQDLPDKTPDGARYSISAVRAALVGLE